MGRTPVVLRTLSSLCSTYLDLEMSGTWDWTINEEMAQTSTTLLPACALSSPYPNLLLALLLQHSIFQCPDYDPELHQFTQPPRTTTQFLCTTTRLSSQNPNSLITRRQNQWRYKYPDVLLWTKFPSFLAKSSLWKNTVSCWERKFVHVATWAVMSEVVKKMAAVTLLVDMGFWSNILKYHVRKPPEEDSVGGWLLLDDDDGTPPELETHRRPPWPPLLWFPVSKVCRADSLEGFSAATAAKWCRTLFQFWCGS